MKAIKFIYIIDSSSLIDLRIHYPIDIFRGIWNNFETLIRKRSLISSIEVLNEITRRDDELTNWGNQHGNIFKPINFSCTEKVKEILTEFPQLADINKITPDADPFIIALALERDPQKTLIPTDIKKVVLTQEKYKENKINIPFVCQSYGIECINLLELFRKERWEF